MLNFIVNLVRKLFWSDWDRKNPKIEWSNLDGSQREIFVQKPNVKLPNSIAIDWYTEEICWADAALKSIGNVILLHNIFKQHKKKELDLLLRLF